MNNRSLVERKKAAISWWNGLHQTQKGLLMEGKFKHRHPQSLIESEIEEIFEHELNYQKSGTEFVMKSSRRSLPSELIAILRNCYKGNINSVTFPANSFDIEYELSCDDKDYVTFWRISEPSIIYRLYVCSTEQTEVPIWKDWYMTINYHA